MSMEKLTIIHISDLHRSRDNPITNISLLSSLIRDIDLCEKEGVSRPDLVIVSGDIVQGSANLKKAVAEIQEQYKEALGFLNDLLSIFSMEINLESLSLLVIMMFAGLNPLIVWKLSMSQK